MLGAGHESAITITYEPNKRPTDTEIRRQSFSAPRIWLALAIKMSGFISEKGDSPAWQRGRVSV